MAAEEWITQREFARRVGVTQPAVNKVIGKRINAREDGKINWATEERKWYANRDPSKLREHNAPKDARKDMEPLAQAKLAKETFTAKLRQAEFELKIGKLVVWEEIEAAQREADIVLMNHLLEIPGRVASGLTASVVEYLRTVLSDHLPADKIEAAVNAIDPQALEHRVYGVWDTESKKIINEVGVDLRGRAGA